MMDLTARNGVFMSDKAMELARKAHDLALKVQGDLAAYQVLSSERHETITEALKNVTTKIDTGKNSIIGLLLTVVGLMAYELLIK